MTLRKDFHKFLTEGEQPVLFAGAGVSAKAGVPVWGEYLIRLAEHARPHHVLTRHTMMDLISESEYLNAAEYYFICKKIPEADKYQFLRKPLDDYDPKEIQPLMRLPFSAVVTTNYDRAPLDAYAMVSGVSAEEVNLCDPTLKSAPFNHGFYIARIHGRVEVPESMVLSESHYKDLIKNKSYVDFLTHLFTHRKILFIGFSFLDPAIQLILDVIEENVGKVHAGRHIALIPNNSNLKFTKKLERYSIKKLTYDPRNNHVELWNLIKAISEELEKEGIKRTLLPVEPFLCAKQYLATCFTRTRLGKRLSPLRNSVIEGIVAELTRNAGQAGISASSLTQKIHEDLSIPKNESTELVELAIGSLQKDGLCVINNEYDQAAIQWVGPDVNHLEDALAKLIDGAMDRFVVREGGVDTPNTRICLKEFISTIIESRGWDLGAAFANNTSPENLDVLSTIQSIAACNSDIDTLGLGRAVNDLLAHPNSDEALLLADLGRLSFAIELVFQSPHDTLFHSLTLPERIYLDANVLMPAMTVGHAYYDVYHSTIDRLIEAAVSALTNVEVCAYSGFLNEVVSHRKLAISQIDAMNGGDIEQLRKEVSLYGSVNLNVFVGAYANMLQHDKGMKFHEFLNKYAPYNDEKELRHWLINKRIIVIDEKEMKTGNTALPDIIHTLECAYNQGQWSAKKGVLILHDAVQLGAIHADIRAGKRSIFVTADRRLRENLSKQKFSFLSNSMVSHIGLFQLVDLLVGNSVEGRGLSRMLWTTQISSATEQIRNYFVDLALNKYHEGLIMEMPKLVDSIAEDAAAELDRQDLDLYTQQTGDNTKVMKTLDGFVDQYFQRMRAVIEEKRKSD